MFLWSRYANAKLDEIPSSPDSRFPIPDSPLPTPYLQIHYRFRTQIAITYYG
ncbi:MULTISPECIES: hypothetical protein [Moorena]|uniref:hypothetical protein n=1 Tax=Moorena TaxID=1155738 RepID=UPI0003145973|nr:MULTISPECIES: hypothetical protein [Moorena]NEP35569.1 hypothetical protein [Moorena sp. SIO3B2]NEP69662.1 hypothetical protein [Moorena sp. SIO3A5]NER86041.1 hypothetical protein [Moorena sp. SIO3A2]NET68908.1 hypothetical protein [Moorena sp. SIO1G6]